MSLKTTGGPPTRDGECRSGHFADRCGHSAVDPDIHEKILAAAARDGVSVSAWMTTAAREALKRRTGLAAIEVWEKQHGRFTSEEMNDARRSVQAQLRTPRMVRRPA